MTTDENGTRSRGRVHKKVRKEWRLGDIRGLTKSEKRVLDEMAETQPDEASVLRTMRRESQGAMTLDELSERMEERAVEWIRGVLGRLITTGHVVFVESTALGDVYYARELDVSSGRGRRGGRRGGSSLSRGRRGRGRGKG